MQITRKTSENQCTQQGKPKKINEHSKETRRQINEPIKDNLRKSMNIARKP